MESKTTLRNSNVEIFRFLLMFGICVWHLLVHGFNLKSMGVVGGGQPTYNQLLIMSILAPCVNCFMFISGYFGISFKREKAIRMFLQATFFFVLIAIVRNVHLAPIIFGERLDFSYFFLNPLPIANTVWWFLTYYFIIMILSPILEKGIEALSKNQFRYTLCALIIINCIGGFLNGRTGGSDLFGLLLVYLIGRYIKKYHVVIEAKYLVILYLCATMALFCSVSFLHYSSHDGFAWTMFRYSNPLIITAALSISLIVIGLKPRNIELFNFLGRHCFAIYLVTEFTEQKIYSFWQRIYMQDGLLSVLAVIFGMCVVIVMFDCIRQMICNPVAEKWKKILKIDLYK